MSLTSRKLVINDLPELKDYTIGYPRGMADTDFIKNDLQPKGIYSVTR